MRSIFMRFELGLSSFGVGAGSCERERQGVMMIWGSVFVLDTPFLLNVFTMRFGFGACIIWKEIGGCILVPCIIDVDIGIQIDESSKYSRLHAPNFSLYSLPGEKGWQGTREG